MPQSKAASSNAAPPVPQICIPADLLLGILRATEAQLGRSMMEDFQRRMMEENEGLQYPQGPPLAFGPGGTGDLFEQALRERVAAASRSFLESLTVTQEADEPMIQEIPEAAATPGVEAIYQADEAIPEGAATPDDEAIHPGEMSPPPQPPGTYAVHPEILRFRVLVATDGGQLMRWPFTLLQ